MPCCGGCKSSPALAKAPNPSLCFTEAASVEHSAHDSRSVAFVCSLQGPSQPPSNWAVLSFRSHAAYRLTLCKSCTHSLDSSPVNARVPACRSFPVPSGPQGRAGTGGRCSETHLIICRLTQSCMLRTTPSPYSGYSARLEQTVGTARLLKLCHGVGVLLSRNEWCFADSL